MENLQELKPVEKLTPFAHFCCTIGNLPTSYMISLTYEEQLLWLCQYLEKTVIPAVNTNAESVAELQNLYIQLKEYVDNYFTNLDVQEEINNKLDEMAQDGTLQNLLMNFTSQMKVYNTYNDLLLDKNNLQNNQKVKILGYYNVNDGGETEFYVTNIKNQNNYIDIGNNLYLERIIQNSQISIEQFGCIGDNNTDNTVNLQNAINFAQNNNLVLYVPNKTFLVLNTLYLKGSLNMKGDSNSNYKYTSTISCNFADNDIPLFAETGSNSVPRCTFENVRFTRKRTANDGMPSDPLSFGKTGTCLGFQLNESSFNRCVFVGFGNVMIHSGITTFLECDFTYCDRILNSPNNNLNSVHFIACNFYANGTLFDINGNITNLDIDNCWIEDFVSLLKSHYKNILNFNITNSCLTNTRKGETLLLYDETGRPSFARQHINFENSTLYFKTNICSGTPSGIEFYLSFNNCDVFYGGNGETINIVGNGQFYNLNGGNINSLTNYGIDSRQRTAYNGLSFIKKNIQAPNTLFLSEQKYIGYRDTNKNLMCMLPVYIVSSPTNTINNADVPRYFIYNNSVTSTGEVILKYVDSVLNITRDVLIL